MKQLLVFILTLLPMVANADAVEINGIWYNIVTKGNFAEVTKNPSISEYTGSYTGDITIPEKITYDGTQYPVTKIGDNAFRSSNKLTSVSIPSSVTSLGDYAFGYCIGIKSIVIPNNVASIGNWAFAGCSKLTSITIPNNVSSIGECVFYNCNSLMSVVIPNSISTISYSFFYGCTSLTSVTIPNNISLIDSYAFYGCSGLTSIIIPNSVTSISSNAFNGCSSLTSVSIPNNVTNIGSYAFKACSGLTSLIIPSSVTVINNGAFQKCDNLNDVYCKPEQVREKSGTGLFTYKDAFADSYPEYITLHVPSASIEAYRAIEPWSKFKEIVALTDGDTPVLPKCATPTISYNNGELSFTCATEGVEFVSEVTVGDAKKYHDAKINLSQSYIVSVYATKSGYEASDVATKEIAISGGSSEQASSVKGDVNNDGKVDVADHVELSKIIMASGTNPGTGTDQNPNPSGDDLETDKITASFLGGAYSSINGKIQSGSQLNVKFSNKSSKSVTLTMMQLNDAATGSEGNNMLSEEVVVAAGQDVSYTITVGILGVSKPVISFTYRYNNKTYQVKGEWQEIEFPNIDIGF